MFLIGFILAGTMADYKESEKIPSEVAASLENIYQEAEYVKKIKPDFNLKAHHDRLLAILNGLEKDLVQESIELTPGERFHAGHGVVYWRCDGCRFIDTALSSIRRFDLCNSFLIAAITFCRFSRSNRSS